MIVIEKKTKPDSFRKLYQRANPLPEVRAKVPLLHVCSGEEDFVLCESTVIAEYVASMEIHNDIVKEKQFRFWPIEPEERAKLRLFIEVCGDSFDSHLGFSRVQDTQQLQAQYSILQQKMRDVDEFLSSRTAASPFTLTWLLLSRDAVGSYRLLTIQSPLRRIYDLNTYNLGFK